MTAAAMERSAPAWKKVALRQHPQALRNILRTHRTFYGAALPVISRSAVGFRLNGDELRPEKISVILGCPPDFSLPKDGTWRTTRGVERIATTGMWHKGVAPRSPGDLDGQIVELLAMMTDDLAVWQQLTTQFGADVFCGLFLDGANEGAELQASTLLALGVRGIMLGFDIYALGTMPSATC